MSMRKLRPTLHGRGRHEGADGEQADGGSEFVEIGGAELSGMFAAPRWLRDLGVMRLVEVA